MKGPWTIEEDVALQKLVRKHGSRNWSVVSNGIPARSGKSCRLRWCNQLSPKVEHCPFSTEENRVIKESHSKHGNKWVTIARLLPGRTDNAVKNHWNSSLCRKQGQACHADGAGVAPSPLSSSDHGRKRSCSSVTNESSSWVEGSLEHKIGGEEEEAKLRKSSKRWHQEEGEVCHVFKPVPTHAPFPCEQNHNDPPTSLSLSLPSSNTEFFTGTVTHGCRVAGHIAGDDIY